MGLFSCLLALASGRKDDSSNNDLAAIIGGVVAGVVFLVLVVILVVWLCRQESPTGMIFTISIFFWLDQGGAWKVLEIPNLDTNLFYFFFYGYLK